MDSHPLLSNFLAWNEKKKFPICSRTCLHVAVTVRAAISVPNYQRMDQFGCVWCEPVLGALLGKTAQHVPASVCLSVRPFDCLSLRLSVCLSVRLSAVCLSVYASVCPSVCLCVCLPVRLSVFASVCLSVRKHELKGC